MVNKTFTFGKQGSHSVSCGERGPKLTTCSDLNSDVQMREKCIGLDQVKYPGIPKYFALNFGDFKWKPREAFQSDMTFVGESIL